MGQALLPRDISAGRNARGRLIITLVMKLALTVGVVSTVLVVILSTYFPGTFTDSPIIQSALQSVTTQAAASQLLICLATVLDGVFLGAGHLKDFVAAGAASTGAAWFYYFFSIRQRLGIVGAWNGLLLFSFIRLLFLTIRFPSIWRKLSPSSTNTDREGVAYDEADWTK